MKYIIEELESGITKEVNSANEIGIWISRKRETDGHNFNWIIREVEE